MSKALIVYGTRYGAAAATAQEIASVLNQKGLEVKVVNAKQEKVKDISNYELVVVGSGVQIHRWTSEPEDFLKKFKVQLSQRKLVLYVCCGSASPAINSDEKPKQDLKAKYLTEKATQIGVHPAAMGYFGGIYDFNKTPWWAKKAMNGERPKIAAAYKETAPNVYDTRDVAAIRIWAAEIAKL